MQVIGVGARSISYLGIILGIAKIDNLGVEPRYRHKTKESTKNFKLLDKDEQFLWPTSVLTPLSTRDVPWFAFIKHLSDSFPFVYCFLSLYALSVIEVSLISWKTRRLMQN